MCVHENIVQLTDLFSKNGLLLSAVSDNLVLSQFYLTFISLFYLNELSCQIKDYGYKIQLDKRSERRF